MAIRFEGSGGDRLLYANAAVSSDVVGQSKLSLVRNAACEGAKSRLAKRQKPEKAAWEAAADMLFQ